MAYRLGERLSIWKLLLCVALLFFLLVDGHRFISRVQYWRRNRKIRQEYIAEVERLRREQRRMKEELQRLKYNRLTQERLAREIGYIKPGETVYKIVPKPHGTAYRSTD